MMLFIIFGIISTMFISFIFSMKNSEKKNTFSDIILRDNDLVERMEVEGNTQY